MVESFYSRVLCFSHDNNRNTRTRCEICSKLTIKTSKRCHWHRSSVFIVKFKHILHLVLISYFNFEHVTAGWGGYANSWDYSTMSKTIIYHENPRKTTLIVQVLVQTGWKTSCAMIIKFVLAAGIYLLKVNNRNTRTTCQICSKLTIKTPNDATGEWPGSGVFIVNFEHISYLALVFLLLTLNI